jgi:hypothetical protein
MLHDNVERQRRIVAKKETRCRRDADTRRDGDGHSPALYCPEERPVHNCRAPHRSHRVDLLRPTILKGDTLPKPLKIMAPPVSFGEVRYLCVFPPERLAPARTAGGVEVPAPAEEAFME